MGRDKAGLVIEGEELWRRQVEKLRSLAPLELLISGKPNGPYMGAEYRVIFDEVADLGPLGGLATALRLAVGERVLVLAVDLPAITSDFLCALLAASDRSARGVVPLVGENLEPLVAIYPRTALPLVEKAIAAGDLSMHHFVARACATGLVELWRQPAEVRSLFANLNTPDDFPS